MKINYSFFTISLIILFGSGFNAVSQSTDSNKKTKVLSIEPFISGGAGWWIFDKAITQQWDRSHYIAQFETGVSARYHLKYINFGITLSHLILDENELIAFDDDAVREKYSIADGVTTFTSWYATAEWLPVQIGRYKGGPTVSFGSFSTSARYKNHNADDEKFMWKAGLSNEISLNSTWYVNVQLLFNNRSIKLKYTPEEKHHIYSLSAQLGIRAYIL